MSAKFECAGQIVAAVNVVWLECNQPPIDRDRFLLSIGRLKSDPQAEPGVGQVGREVGRLAISGNRFFEPRLAAEWTCPKLRRYAAASGLGDNGLFDQCERLVVPSQLQGRDAAQVQRIGMTRVRREHLSIEAFRRLAARPLDGARRLGANVPDSDPSTIRSVPLGTVQTGSNQAISRIEAVRFSRNTARTRPPTFSRSRSCCRTTCVRAVSAPSRRISAKPYGVGNG